MTFKAVGLTANVCLTPYLKQGGCACVLLSFRKERRQLFSSYIPVLIGLSITSSRSAAPPQQPCSLVTNSIQVALRMPLFRSVWTKKMRLYPARFITAVDAAARVSPITSQNGFQTTTGPLMCIASTLTISDRGMRPKWLLRAVHAARKHNQSPIKKGIVPAMPTSANMLARRLWGSADPPPSPTRPASSYLNSTGCHPNRGRSKPISRAAGILNCRVERSPPWAACQRFIIKQLPQNLR
jgi:hypothetical protein